MSFDPVPKPSCEGCGSTMAENRAGCNLCDTAITKLISESKSLSIKDEPSSSSKAVGPKAFTSISSKTGQSPSVAPVTEDEIRTFLQSDQITIEDLASRFKGRVKNSEDKKAFTDILRVVSKIRKSNGHKYVVLRDK